MTHESIYVLLSGGYPICATKDKGKADKWLSDDKGASRIKVRII